MPRNSWAREPGEKERMSMMAIAIIPNGFLVLDSKPSVSPKETSRLWIL